MSTKKLVKAGKGFLNLIRGSPSSNNDSNPAESTTAQPRRKGNLTKRPLSEHHLSTSEIFHPPRKSVGGVDILGENVLVPQPVKQKVSRGGARRPGTIPKMWTPAEDAALREAVKMYGERNWREIAAHVPGRNQLQCNQRWKKALMPGLVKGKWEKAEDKKLLSLVNPKEENDFTKIAEQIPGRNAKQCKERWFLNLDPSIKRGPWTEDEDKQLLALHATYGGRWCILAKMIAGRTENNVKTRYHSLMRQEAKTRGWTPQEDQVLIESLTTHGKEFEFIAKALPGRTQGMVKKRFTTLVNKDPSLAMKLDAIEAAKLQQKEEQPRQKRMPEKKASSWLEGQPVASPGPGSMLRTDSQQVLLGFLEPQVEQQRLPQAMGFPQQQQVPTFENLPGGFVDPVPMPQMVPEAPRKTMPERSTSLSMLEQLLSGDGDIWEEADRQVGATNNELQPIPGQNPSVSFPYGGDTRQKRLAPRGTYGSSGNNSLLDLLDYSRISQDPRVSTGSSRSLLGDLEFSLGGSSRSLGSTGRGIADMRPLAEVLNT